MKIAVLATILCIGLIGPSVINAQMTVYYSWKQLKFDWPSEQAEAAAIASGQYIPNNNMPLGLERWKNKLFITVPRWKEGVASALNYVDVYDKSFSPVLHPYPSWEANTLPESESDVKNDTIVSPFRMKVDNCDRLWVLDTGLSVILGDGKQITPNSLLIFDLKTDKLIHRYEIPNELLQSESFLANIAVDSDSDKCDNAYAYLPDLGGYAVIVYSLRDNHSYRVTHPFFNYDPELQNLTVSGESLSWTDGVFGMAVGPKNSKGEKEVFFHPLVSNNEFSVSNAVLQDEARATSSDNINDFKLIGKRGENMQSSAEEYDPKTGVLFYGVLQSDGVGCWNVKQPLVPYSQGLVFSDPILGSYPNDLQIDDEGVLWVLTDRMPQFTAGTMDFEDVNYRILAAKTRDIIKRSPCASKTYRGQKRGRINFLQTLLNWI